MKRPAFLLLFTLSVLAYPLSAALAPDLILKEKVKEADDLNGRSVNVPSQKIKKGKGILEFTVLIPEDYKLTQDAPHHLEWKPGSEALRFTGKTVLDSPKISFPLSMAYEAGEGELAVQVNAMLYYCRKDSTLCFFDEMQVTIPLQAGDEGTDKPEVRVPLKVRNA